jgi:hypothetical protein
MKTMSDITAGVVAAIPLSVLGILYMLIGGKRLVQALKSSEAGEASMTDQQWFYLMLGSLALAPFAFGIVAGLVYGWLGNQQYFLGLALGMAVVFSIFAWVSHTPLKLTKIVMNFLVALDFGILLPLLAS